MVTTPKCSSPFGFLDHNFFKNSHIDIYVEPTIRTCLAFPELFTLRAVDKYALWCSRLFFIRHLMIPSTCLGFFSAHCPQTPLFSFPSLGQLNYFIPIRDEYITELYSSIRVLKLLARDSEPNGSNVRLGPRHSSSG
jgi:hypothetical protein